MFQLKKEGSKQNILVSDFRKMFARQISDKYKYDAEQIYTVSNMARCFCTRQISKVHRRRFQNKCSKSRKLVHNVKSMTTSTFECKFVCLLLDVQWWFDTWPMPSSRSERRRHENILRKVLVQTTHNTRIVLPVTELSFQWRSPGQRFRVL